MAKKAYIGVDGKASAVKKIYIGVDGKARKVKKAYIGVDGVAKLFFSSAIPFESNYTSGMYLNSVEVFLNGVQISPTDVGSFSCELESGDIVTIKARKNFEMKINDVSKGTYTSYDYIVPDCNAVEMSAVFPSVTFDDIPKPCVVYIVES